MTQTHKTKALLSTSLEKFLTGKILDIGAGRDPISPQAQIFDKQHGNAEDILDYLANEEFDTIYSSHYLEHMSDPQKAINDWWKLLKPGGFMVIITPDNDLYEQGIWPSLFNKEHKATFTFGPITPGSRENHYNLIKLIDSLDGAEIIDSEVQDNNYDYNLLGKKFGKIRRKIYSLAFTKSGMVQRLFKLVYRLTYTVGYKSAQGNKHGKPIDQTLSHSLAQLMVIAEKK